MPRVATLSLREILGDRMLGEVARILCAAPEPPAFVERLPVPPPPPPADTTATATDGVAEDDDDLEAFLDWDIVRGHGRGYFRSDARECATRRVDLRGPTDLDPGPLPMEEAPADAVVGGMLLMF